MVEPTPEDVQLLLDATTEENVLHMFPKRAGYSLFPPMRLRLDHPERLPAGRTLNENMEHIFNTWIRRRLAAAGGNLETTKFWLNIHHPRMQLSTDGFRIPMRTFAQANGHTIVNTLADIIQSNADVAVDDTFTLTMRVFPPQSRRKGKGGRLSNAIMKKLGLSKEMVIGSSHCMPKALAIGVLFSNMQRAHADGDVEKKTAFYYKYKALTRATKHDENKEMDQLEAAKKLLTAAGLDAEEVAHDSQHLEKLAEHLCDYQIRVWELNGTTNVPIITQELNCFNESESDDGLDEDAPQGSINLFYEAGHYEFFTPALERIQARFCYSCCKMVKDRCHFKKCAAKCRRCGAVNCGGDWKSLESVKCTDCDIVFKTRECYERHLQKTRVDALPFCKKYVKCQKCFKIHTRFEYTQRRHVCYATGFCRHCCEFYKNKNDHDCSFKVPTEKNKEKLREKQKNWTFVIYDFESIIHDPEGDHEGKHIPNLVCYRIICAKCLGQGPCAGCGSSGKVDHLSYVNCGDTPVVTKFVELLMTNEKLQNAYIIAHNGGRYDHVFTIAELTEAANASPTFLTNGHTIISTAVKVTKKNTLTFRDSCQYLKMPLADMPKAFNLKTKAKGFFPYKLNHPGYYGKVLDSLPPREDFEPENMHPKTATQFNSWYEENAKSTWDFDAILLEYCEDDVQILTEAVVEYLKRCDVYFNGWNPIVQASTLAGFVMFMLKVEHIKDGDVGFIPENGFPSRNNSEIALKYLLWLEHVTPGLKLQHALSGGEKALRIGGRVYYVDGYDEATNTVYELHGCFWHGCCECFPVRDATNSVRKDCNMGQLYEQTMEREKIIREAGYKLVSVWEHEVLEATQKDPAMKKWFAKCRYTHNLKPREAMYGGRTQQFKAFAKATQDIEIRHLDFCSLYPFINILGTMYPRGQPKVIKRNFEKIIGNKLPYRGVLFGDLLPPTGGIDFPIIPQRGGGKLLFPLCNSCVSDMEQKVCTHRKISERFLTGVWCTDEIEAALEQGYKLLRIHEVWHWPDDHWFRGGFFASFLKPLLKVKHEASGWPRDGMSQEEKQTYIQQIYEKDGVLMDEHNIERNVALRSWTKLFLNSAWGKFAQNPRKTETRLISADEPDTLATFLNHPSYEPQIIEEWGENHVLVSRISTKDATTTSNFTNIVIGVLTTSAARLRLYEAMKCIGVERFLYCDTDSVIYEHDLSKPDPVAHLRGDGLGMLTDEVGEHLHIEEAVFLAPKVYSLRYKHDVTGAISYKTKAKGMTLNSETAAKINFDTMKELMQKQLVEGDAAGTLQARRMLFKRGGNVLDGVETVWQTKRLRPVMDKGFFDKEGVMVPYGWVDGPVTLENDYLYK